MPEFCTCGAELPPDARFCHRCGKPQREEAAPPAEERPVLPPAFAPPRARMVSTAVSFHNPAAVRVGLTVGGIAALLSWLPLVQLGFAIWWIAAGFFAVHLYRRRTGELLSVNAGVRLGWVTGVLTFVIMTVLFALALVPILVQRGGLIAVYQEQLRSMHWDDAKIQQAMQVLNNPAVLITGILFTLLFLFVIVTILCTAGGALGAKVSQH